MAGEGNQISADFHPAHNPWLIAATVMLATFMEVLDTTIVNVALPHIAGNLSASVDESTWVLTSYLVSNAIVLPLSGWFSQLVGRKRFYIGCVVLFTISSFLCGLAPTIMSLVIFRVCQGAGGGALQPISQSILAESFPRERRGMAMAVYGMGVVVAPIIGPTLGGWITDNYSWRWIFFINIPVGFISVLLTSTLIKDPAHLVRKSFANGLRIDYFGLGLLSIGLGSLQIVLDKGEREDWFSSHFIVVFSIIAVVCLLVLIFWEWHSKHPVVELHLVKDRNFASATFMMFMVGFVLYGSTVLLPLFLQTLMGYDAMTSGLALSPGGVVTLITMPVVGFLLTKIQPKWLIISGLLVGAIGLYEMTQFNLGTSFGFAVWSRMVLSASLGFLFVPINTSAYYYLPKEKYDQASGLINLARNLGGSFGISIVTTLLARRAQFHQNMLVAHVTEYNPVYRQYYQGARELLMQQGTNVYASMLQAKALIYSMVSQQAMMLAFIDNFWIMVAVFLALIPLVIFMRKIRPGKPQSAVILNEAGKTVMKKTGAVLTAVLVMVLVSGCNVGPNYKRPDVNMPAKFTSADPNAVSLTPAKAALWWKKFNDPVLDSLISQAARENWSIKSAQAVIQQSREQLIIAGAPEYPNVNVDASATRSRQSRNTAFSFGPTMQNSFQAGFDASWELDIFGGTRRAIESARANLEVSEENRGNVLISVLSEVARDYVQMRAYQQRLIITYNNLKTQQDSLDIADARFKSGLTSELNVAQQKAQLASTAAQIPTLEMGLEQSIHAIGVLLAKDPGALRAELIKNGPIPEVTEPNVPVGVPSELLRRRPDVRLAERQLAAATAQIGVAAAQLYPSVTLTGSIGLESAKTNHLLNRHSEFWSAGPGLSWPIFNAGQIRANVRLQKAITDEGLDNYQQMVLSAMQDVEDSMTAYIKEQARMRQLRVAVTANERSLQLSQDMYQKGLTDFLNVLTAQASLFAAEDLLAQSQGNVSQDVIALYKALGGGWQE